MKTQKVERRKKYCMTLDEKAMNEARKVFGPMGLSSSEAVNVFLRWVAKEKKMPGDTNEELHAYVARVLMEHGYTAKMNTKT